MVTPFVEGYNGKLKRGEKVSGSEHGLGLSKQVMVFRDQICQQNIENQGRASREVQSRSKGTSVKLWLSNISKEIFRSLEIITVNKPLHVNAG